jgi:Flp pilus assembly protein TadB
MTPTNKEQAAHEIRKLEHDLENLERCYAALEQSARWAKLLFFVFIAALIALVLWGVVIDNLELAAMSLLALIFCTLFRFNWRFKRIRWIDMVSHKWGGVQRTEAKAIEDMIADRKARLAALRRE